MIAFDQNIGNKNFLGNAVRFGDYTQRVVQFPIVIPPRRLKPGNETIIISDAVTKARPVHVANLPNGDILFFSGSIYGQENEQHEFDRSDSVAIFRPATNEILPVEGPPFDIFCAGHSTLGNGNVVIMGGTLRREEEHRDAHHWPGLQDVTVFDWRKSTFKTLSYAMREGRWYPSSVVLGNGEVFICDGHPTLASIPHTNFDLEILSADGEQVVTSIENGNVSMGSADFTEYGPDEDLHSLRAEFQGLYPRMMLLPNGEIFSASSLRSLPTIPENGKVEEVNRENMKIVAPEFNEETDKYQNSPNVNGRRVFRDNSFAFRPNQPWISRQIFEATKEAPEAHGPIWGFDDPAVLLPLDVNSTSDEVRAQPRVMTFLNGRDCTIEPDSPNATWVHAHRKRDISIDFKGRKRNDRYRQYGNLVLLPDGSVMAVGGVDTPYLDGKPDVLEDRKVEEVEYFIPGATPSQDYWRTDKESRVLVPRHYHSTAILLLDGRVMVGGGNVSDEYFKVHKEKSFREIEIITPDYYNNGSQPEFVVEGDTLSYGEVVPIRLLNDLSVVDLSTYTILIRCASFTHAFGYDQRAVRLYPHGSMTTSRYEIRIPRNGNIVPPGYYMWFIVSKKGVPSCGQMVKIG